MAVVTAQKTNGLDTVNLVTAGIQRAPTIDRLSDGTSVIAWLSGSGVSVRKLDSAGEPTGAEVPVSTAAAGEVQVLALTNGNFVVAWISSSFDIKGQIYNPALQPVGSQLTLFDSSKPFYDFDIDKLPNGGFATAAELAYSSTDHDLHVKTFSANGTQTGVNYISPTTYDFDPSIAVLSNGTIVVSYTQETVSGSNFIYHTYATLYSSTPTSGGSLTVLSPPTQIYPGTREGTNTELVAIPNGQFYLLESTNPANTGHDDLSPTYSVRTTISGAANPLFMGLGPTHLIAASAASPAGYVAALDQTGGDVNLIVFEPPTSGGTYSQFYNVPLITGSASQWPGDLVWINNYTIQVTSYVYGGVGFDGSGTAIVTGRYLIVRTSDLSYISTGILLEGNALIDVMLGGSGNDTMDGAGGPDTMSGGAGNDTYYVDSAGDVVDEQSAGSSGYDTVRSWITYTLPNNVEALVLVGSGAINGTGNALANTLVGNSGNNRLDGSFGADLMKGFAGNDTYVVDNAGDVVNEIDPGSSGWDTVYSSIDYKLGANLEALVLTGALKLDGSGNGLDNFIAGNGKANVLKGGSGNDTVRGGGGKDVMDGGKGSRDIADYSDKTKAVSATLNGSSTVTVKVNGNAEDKIKNFEGLFGGTKGDSLRGDSKANVLDGRLGVDTLEGKGGKDQFVFTSMGKANADKIVDFLHDTDKIALENTVFAAIGAKLDKSEFYAKAGAKAAHDANDHIIYDTSTGKLYYDADGMGGAKAVLFATLTNHPGSLDHGDFTIV